jgi:hypothetical protein
LSHQSDLKVTYSNGFHVNFAITALDRLNLESSNFNQEYDSFFKATQPIIDEESLNPTEFNLVSGIYLADSINLVTHKKNIPYVGCSMGADYKCLDFALTNMSMSIRKYLMTNLGSVDLTLQQYIQTKMKVNEKEYEGNPTIYSNIL